MSQDGQDGYDDSDVEWSDEEYAAYEAESASVARARSRRRKAAVTVALLALALFFAFWWAWSYYKESAEGTKPTAGPSAGATCQPDGDGVVAPQKITVNVFNSTTKAGLAAGAAKEFSARGFLVGTVSNDPQKKQIPGAAGPPVLPTGTSSSRPSVRVRRQSRTRARRARSTSPSGKASPRWASCPSGPGRCVLPRRPHRVREHPQGSAGPTGADLPHEHRGRGRGPRVSRSLAGQRRPGRCRW